jgi:hypothetical protein
MRTTGACPIEILMMRFVGDCAWGGTIADQQHTLSRSSLSNIDNEIKSKPIRVNAKARLKLGQQACF